MSHTPSLFRHTQNSQSDTAGWTPVADSRFGEFGRVCVYAAMTLVPLLGLGVYLVNTGFAEQDAARAIFQERMATHDRLVASPPLSLLPVEQLVRGKHLFEATCGACHKPNGTGVDGLGKDLTQSWFVSSLDDSQLGAFLVQGRSQTDPLNTTKIPMPPKGGRDDLSAADIGDLVTFVRGLQDPRRMPPLPASAYAAAPIAPPTEAEKATALAAAGGNAELAEYIAHGTKLFGATCSACHGKDAHGLPSLGKDLVKSDFTRKLDDDALLAFVKRGRDPSDPLNTSKVSMPPKGGNPALSDDDLLDIIAYVRSLQKQAGSTQ